MNLRICKIWFGHLSLSLKFKDNPVSGCRDISLKVCFEQGCQKKSGFLPMRDRLGGVSRCLQGASLEVKMNNEKKMKT